MIWLHGFTILFPVSYDYCAPLLPFVSSCHAHVMWLFCVHCAYKPYKPYFCSFVRMHLIYACHIHSLHCTICRIECFGHAPSQVCPFRFKRLLWDSTAWKEGDRRKTINWAQIQNYALSRSYSHASYRSQSYIFCLLSPYVLVAGVLPSVCA